MNVKWPFETFVNLQIPNRSACDGSWFGHSWKGYTCSQRGCPANWGYICSITTIFCNFWHPPFLKEWSSGEVLLCRNGFRSESGGVCPHGWMSGESKSVIAQQGVCKCPPPPGTPEQTWYLSKVYTARFPGQKLYTVRVRKRPLSLTKMAFSSLSVGALPVPETKI